MRWVTVVSWLLYGMSKRCKQEWRWPVKTKRERELEAEIAKLEAQVKVLKEVVVGVQERAVEKNMHKDSTHPTMFTPKQHAVLQAMHQGWSTQKMADALETTESTVKGHIKSIMDKVGVRTRVQLVKETRTMLDWEPEEYAQIAQIPLTWARDGGVGGERRVLTHKTR